MFFTLEQPMDLLLLFAQAFQSASPGWENLQFSKVPRDARAIASSSGDIVPNA